MRIAIFEEEPPQMQLLVATLERQISADAEVISCTQFSDAKALKLALSEGSLFDLLILDYNYEEFGGLALLRWLRTYQKSTVPVIMLSQRNSERDIADSLSAGADDFVAKPFRPIELMTRVARFRPKENPCPVAETFGSCIDLSEREFNLAIALFRNLGACRIANQKLH